MHIYMYESSIKVISLAILGSFHLTEGDSKEEFKNYFEKWMHSWNKHKALQENHVLLHLEVWVHMFLKNSCLIDMTYKIM